MILVVLVLTKFLKTVDIFVKRDANHLEVAFWFVNNSMELVLDSTCFFVGNREALTSLRQTLETSSVPLIQSTVC